MQSIANEPFLTDKHIPTIKNMGNILAGVGVALVTPFKDNGDIDFDALEGLVAHVIDGGVDYIVSLGTTAETPTLAPTERQAVLECVKSSAAGRLPVVIGIGGNDTASVIRDFDKFDMSGVEAILSVTPYYNKPSQEGLYRHYAELAKKAPRPLILYNVPSRTGVNLTAETSLRLARDFGNIIAVKEACGDIEQFERLLDGRPQDFAVVSGDDCMTLPLIERGGDGVISVVANAVPAQIKKMTAYALDGNMDGARKEWERMSLLASMMFEEGNPAGVKAALVAKGLISANLRLPLVPASEDLSRRIRNEMETQSFIYPQRR